MELGTLQQLQVSQDGSKIATSDSNYNTLIYGVEGTEIKVYSKYITVAVLMFSVSQWHHLNIVLLFRKLPRNFVVMNETFVDLVVSEEGLL